MRFAYSTSIEPAWGLAAIVAKPAEFGYSGIEVHLPDAASGQRIVDTPLVERELVRLAFGQADIELAGISTALSFTGIAGHDAETSSAVRSVIDLAERLKCGQVRILDMRLPHGLDVSTAAMRFAATLLPLADHAGAAGVTLLVQNAFTFRTARPMWRVLEQANHPFLAAAWDPLTAALDGESPAQSVPVLNSRIGHVLLRDAKIIGEGSSRKVDRLQALGAGDLHIRKLIDRLRGIGYQGWASVTYPPTANLGTADEVLRQSMEQIDVWRSEDGAKTSGTRRN